MYSSFQLYDTLKLPSLERVQWFYSISLILYVTDVEMLDICCPLSVVYVQLGVREQTTLVYVIECYLAYSWNIERQSRSINPIHVEEERQWFRTVVNQAVNSVYRSKEEFISEVKLM